MAELLTSAQMRAIEAAAIASGGVTGLELMERAGRGVVEAIFAEWPDLAAESCKAVVLCGPGNNGGDGFVVARLLKEWGWEVEVFLYGDAERLPPDAAMARKAWIGPIAPLDQISWPLLAPKPLVIDALFGTGLARSVAGGVWGALDMALSSGCRIVAIDIVSGLCADSGRVRSEMGFLEQPVDLTVTFDRPRLGHRLGVAAVMSRRLVVADIGLERWREAFLRTRDAEVVCDGVPGGLLQKEGGHKFSHGHALILSGAPGHGGAARLAARGALRIGAGLVTVGCAPKALAENAARLDAVMLREVADGAAVEAVLEDRRINALCVGPGLGVARAAEILAVVLGAGAALRPVVIDADGLTALAGDAGLFGRLHPGCVLTPHGGEFARLFPEIAAKLEAPATTGPAYSKVDATREAARRAGCVVLFKGADTVIAAPDGRCSVNSAHYERAAPWLATAGSGDVLAGFIAGLLARGFAPIQAAETAVWLHVECARAFGPGLIAEDLPEALPGVFRALGI